MKAEVRRCSFGGRVDVRKFRLGKILPVGADARGYVREEPAMQKQEDFFLGTDIDAPYRSSAGELNIYGQWNGDVVTVPGYWL